MREGTREEMDEWWVGVRKDRGTEGGKGETKELNVEEWSIRQGQKNEEEN